MVSCLPREWVVTITYLRFSALKNRYEAFGCERRAPRECEQLWPKIMYDSIPWGEVENKSSRASLAFRVAPLFPCFFLKLYITLTCEISQVPLFSLLSLYWSLFLSQRGKETVKHIVAKTLEYIWNNRKQTIRKKIPWIKTTTNHITTNHLYTTLARQNTLKSVHQPEVQSLETHRSAGVRYNLKKKS